MSRDLVVALSGGIGGAKLALGLSRILAPDNLIVVANVGDDFEHLGLHVSPDSDTLMYALAGLDNTKLGWGRRDETWSFMETLVGARRRRLVPPRRSRPCGSCRAHAPAQGGRASLRHHRRFLPPPRRRSARACRRPTTGLRTRLRTDEGWLDFQDYFVRLQCRPQVRELAFDGAEDARPHPDLIAALERRTIARGGRLPVQSVHQRRADPRRQGNARGSRPLRRACRRRFADHRRPRGQGSHSQDDDRSWA